MNSKERVLTTFTNKTPDRVPIDYFANSGIDKRLKEYFGLALDDNEGLRQKLGVDFREISPPYKGPHLHEEVTGLSVDIEWGIRTRYIEHESGNYWDYCDFPLRDADLKKVEAWPMPSPNDYDYNFIAETCRRYPDYALFIGGAGFCVIS